MTDSLRHNLNELIAAYEEQKARADILEGQLLKYRKSAESAQEKVKELEDKVDNLSLRNVFTPSSCDATDNSLAKKKIDGLIAAIDKALEMLQ